MSISGKPEVCAPSADLDKDTIRPLELSTPCGFPAGIVLCYDFPAYGIFRQADFAIVIASADLIQGR